MFDIIEQARLSELHIASDTESQLRAIVAIHNTHLGPALGGCRFLEYDSELDAIQDAIRLARGMTYKAALADVPQGGGKSVIIKPKALHDRKRLFAAFGRFVNDLGGRYYTAVDSGSTIDDMEQIAQETNYVVGTSSQGGDPSPLTALGVLEGIRSCVKVLYGQSDLQDIHIAIQGIGNVGFPLAEMLHAEGARLTVSDINQRQLERAKDQFNATIVAPDQITAVGCDIFAPCGLGGTINEQSITHLACKAIAGSANNQLADDALGAVLKEQNILYAPDYIINAGGLIHVSLGKDKVTAEVIRQKVLNIGRTVYDVLVGADKDNLPTNIVANTMAEERIWGGKE